MSDDDGCEYFMLGLFFGALIATVCILIIGGVVSDLLSARCVDVDSKVTNVVMNTNFMTVTFANNETYNINFQHSSSSNYDSTVDFDQSSKILVRLRYSNGWFSPNTDDCWGIVSLVKY